MLSPEDLVGQIVYSILSAVKKAVVQVCVMLSAVATIFAAKWLGYFLVAMALVSGMMVLLWLLIGGGW